MIMIEDFRNCDWEEKNEAGQKILLKGNETECKNNQYMVVEIPGENKPYIFQVWYLKGERYSKTYCGVQKAYKTFKGAEHHFIKVLNFAKAQEKKYFRK